MKKVIIPVFLFIIIGFNSVYAQTLTYQNSGMTVGDVSSMRLADTANVLPGQAGTNITWDFSGLLIGTDIVSQTAVSPAATPYSASFPTANVATENNGSYNYFKCDASEYTSIGTADSSSVIIFSDPGVTFKYPVAYGYSLTDSFAADAGILTIKGVTITNADGKGTIIVAGKNFNNVLRIKTISHGVDSSMFFTMEVNSERYAWYDCIHKTPLLSITTMEIITSFGNTIYTKTVGVSNDIITNINKNSTLAENKIEIYPNPAHNFITLSFNIEKPSVKISCDIINLSGKTVKKQMISDAKTGINTLQLDLTELPRGIYFVNLVQGNLKTRNKLVLY